MMEFIQFATTNGFWVFIGCLIFVQIPFTFVFKVINRTLRHANIRKHGYPPVHCDADGDFKPEPEEDEE